MNRAAIYFAILGALALAYPVYRLVTVEKKISAEKKILVGSIDHALVAADCLDLMTNPVHQGLRGRSLSGSDPRLPVSILNLHPIWVSIADQRVVIDLFSGFHQLRLYFVPSPSNPGQYDLFMREEMSKRKDTPLYTLKPS